MHFINCTWKSSQYYIIISMMTSLMRMSQKLVFHQSKCICTIKRILSTTTMYVSSSSFMHLRIPCYCDACLNSSALCVGVGTLLNTITPIKCVMSYYLIAENDLSPKRRRRTVPFRRYEVSFLEQTLDNFMQIKVEALGYWKKIEKIVWSGTPRQFRSLLS